MKLNKKTIIILVIVVIITILIGFLIFFGNNDKVRNLKRDQSKKLNQDSIVINDSVDVSNFSVRYYAANKKWYIEMLFTNTKDEEVDLKDYQVNAYDKNNNLVKTFDVNMKLESKETKGLTIESQEDVF